MPKIWIKIIIFCVCTLAVPLFAKDQIPEPKGWVNDYAGVISDHYRQKMDSLISDLERKTSAEIAVLTVSSIAPYDERSYARLIFDSWRPGKKGKDNGVLVLLAVKERRWRIETGYGIEGTLSDGLCGEIGRNYMVPYFKDGKYGEGLYNGVSAIAQKISDEAKVTLSGSADLKHVVRKKETAPFLMYIFIPIFFFLWNLPWPVFIGLPFTLLFAFALSGITPFLGILVVLSYIASLLFRLHYWHKTPSHKRKNFFGPQAYGGTFTTGGWSGGGGFGGGGGGFGGGGGGGGGAGGGF
ncbi:MAG: TPM domain-containing protein [Candidatus Omnitrophica bacterium]|nr:TPM domain-containing protein [Candidatus Omnitrophota bacterium]